jgi:uncharacterized caspase-like protein
MRQGPHWGLQLAATLVLAIAGCTSDAPGPLATAAQAVEAAGSRAPAQAVDAAPPDGNAAAGRSERLPAAVPGSRRYALVFGTGAYRHGDALTAPPRDAALMARALQARGYHVLVGIDRDMAGMRDDLAAFEALSRDAGLRLFYFAGHGFEVEGVNYLMPVDLPANIGSLRRQDVLARALRLDQLAWELEQDTDVLVAIIDACRVPAARGAGDTLALAAQEPARGTILAYATAPGRVAMDSLRAYGVDEDNSPYSYYLASALMSPEVHTWDQAFMTAYNVVNHRTRGAQQPWMNTRVSRFPAVGPLQSAPVSPMAGVLGVSIPPERRAAGRYWAGEEAAVLRLAADRTRTDAELAQQSRKGDAHAAMALATRRAELPGKANVALPLLKPLAEGGNPVAQLHLGTLLYALAAEDGDGRDARYWWTLASAQGIGEARAKLAMLDGDGAGAMQGLWEQYEAFRPRPGEPR